MTLVVTGATGQLGALVVGHLLARGAAPDSIRATGRNPEKLAALAAQGVQTAVADYSDRESLDAALEGATAVLLISGSEVGRRIEQHRNVVAAAVAAGVSRILYTSAPYADTTALVVAPEHKATEQIIRASGIPFTILRHGWYIENYLGSLDEARRTGGFLTSVGEGRVSAASRNDFAEADAVVLTTEGHDGAVYELGGDVPFTVDDFAAAFGEVLGSPVEARRVSTEEHLAALVSAGLDEGTAGFVVGLDANTRDGALEITTGTLGSLIGRPTTSLVDGLRAALPA